MTQTPVTSIPGIGPVKANLLKKLNINTLNDLLKYYPRSYLDLRHPIKINQLKPKSLNCFKATLHTPTYFRTKSNKPIFQVIATDETGQTTLIWFNNRYISKIIKENEEYTIIGTPSFFGNKLTIISPQIELLEGESSSSIHTQGIVPIYPQTKGINSKWIRDKINFTLTHTTIIPPPIHPIIKRLKLTPYKEALKQIHFPQTIKKKLNADLRLSFDKHLAINLNNIKQKQKLGQSIKIQISQKIHKKTQDRLPFQTTPDQKKAIREIYQDLKKITPTHRLIQGDTGSGKTVLTIFASAQVLQQGYSVCLLAPTQILAKQHHQTFKKLSSLETKLVMGTSKLKASPKQATVFIGTHALLSQISLQISPKIAIIFIDEQHRFGVKQRQQLIHRTPTPHLFNLTATPIPRTLALGIFGDIEISNIKNAPKFKKKIKTWVIGKTYLKTKGQQWLKNKLHKQQKIFVVCPLIQESNKLKSVSSITKIFQEYKQLFPKTKIFLLHGKLVDQEKTKIIKNFRQEKSAILVATSIIEVGIDIPEANIMIIHSAERFGLATLHQLRGRVGRGNMQGYCFLIPSSSNEDDGEEHTRLDLLSKYHSGLTLAKLDLKLRGAGDFSGLKQHGHLPTRLKYFWNRTLYQRAKIEAKRLYRDFPKKADKIRKQLYYF